MATKTKHKYEVVIDYLKEHYIDNHYSDDGKIISEPELAKKLKMSRFPVNQAFNKLVEQGLITRVSGVGTFVAGKEPRKFQNRGIQKIAGIASYPGTLSPAILQGIQDVLVPQGILTVNVLNNGIDSDDQQILERLKSLGAVGLLMIPPVHFGNNDNPCLKAVNKIAGKGLLPIILERPLNGFNGSKVIVDNAGGTAMATEYLLNAGHQKVAYIGKDDYKVGQERYKGYTNALFQNSNEIDESLIYLDRSDNNFINNLDNFISDSMDQLLTDHPDCKAFVTFGTTVAYRLYLYLKEQNLLTPDMTFAGYDPVPFYDKEFNNHFILIERPLYEIGRIGAETLVNMINNEEEQGIVIKRIMPNLYLSGEKSNQWQKQLNNGL